ncbi:hypothetical protein MMC30_005453 [Trapelia coarctata]|nr:hypothetical protein [Trapelia coarctata]
MESREESYVSEINGKGFIKGMTVLDAGTGRPKCHRLGGIPYAQPLTQAQRWRRAKPLPEDLKYGTKESPTDFTGLSAECPQSGAPFDTPSMREDCLQCNIWIPSGTPPRGGWPVWMYIHGGFLQWGSPNREDAANLLSETSVRCIIVAPTYRLNVFGFLASHELFQEASASGNTVGNIGFWDQRLALEWTHDNIEGFGGNKKSITVGGLSAGAYSTFHQLAYELALPEDQAIIRRVVLFSNGAGLPPKSLHEVQSHFDMLLTALDIPKEMDANSKLEQLRSLPVEELTRATAKIPENSFRAVNDGQWVRHSLFQEIEDGRFARTILRRGTKIMIGDLPDENNVYKLVQPPSSYDSLVQRLSVEYPDAAAKKLAKLYCPGGALPTGSTWLETFGHIYADMQVHVTERGLLAALSRTLPLSSIYRYRIEWRAECVKKFMPLEMGVAHGCDLTVWFYGNGHGLLPQEQRLIEKFLQPFAAFLSGEERGYGTGGIEEVRAILPDMSIRVIKDKDWARCQDIWNSLQLVRLSRL